MTVPHKQCSFDNISFEFETIPWDDSLAVHKNSNNIKQLDQQSSKASVSYSNQLCVYAIFLKGLIIGLPLLSAHDSVLPLEQNGAQFCHRFWRSCSIEAKRPGFKRFRLLPLLKVGPDLTGRTAQ
jgi:hypothetical protein